jgi:pimeloyl-ACP methyl ester carboxylesterase
MSTVPDVILGVPPAPSSDLRAPLRSRHPRRWAAGVALALLGLLGGALWSASDTIAHETFDARPAPYWPRYDDVQVIAVDPGHVSLLQGPAPAPSADTPGLYGLGWDGGAGLLGDAWTTGSRSVVREFTLVAGGMPEVGEPAALQDSYWVGEPSGLGLWYRSVLIAGSYPGWFVQVDGHPSTIAIVVHGRNGSRRDALRVLDTLARAGLSTLVITYRNDAAALSDGDGRLGYGVTEWPDLEAAVGWALEQGAEDVVLVGQSMGGSVVAAFLEHSHLAGSVRRVVLDAPILSLEEVALASAGSADGGVGLPEPARSAAVWLAGARWGVDWAAADYLDDTSWVRTPTLVVHGSEDLVVPVTQSRELAAAVPDLVRLLEVPGAGHVRSWNVDRAGWTAAVTSFLDGTS